MNPQAQHGVSQHHRIRGSRGETDDASAQQIDKAGGNQAPQGAEQQDLSQSGADSRPFSGTVILGGEHGKGGAEGAQRLQKQLNQPTGGGVGGDDGDAQGVGGALENYGADVHHYTHKRHGGAGGDQLQHQLPGNPEILPPGQISPEIAHQKHTAQQTADHLGDHGSQGSARHAQGKTGHQQKIQGNVQKACEDQEHQRGPAVPQGIEKPGEHIVADGGQ